MVSQYLPSDKLNAPDAAPSELNLTILAYLDFLLVADAILQWWTVHQAAQRIQHLWDAIIGKHGYLVNIVKAAIAFAIEASPQVANKDLRSFVEAHGLAMETGLVPEARKIVYQEIDKSSCGSVCFRNAVRETAVEALIQYLTGFSQAVKSFMKEGNLFICRRPKDMTQHIFCALFCLLPKIRASDRETYILAINQLTTTSGIQTHTFIKCSLQCGNKAPVASPLPVFVVNGKAVFGRSF